MEEQTKLSVDLIISNKNQKCNFVKKKRKIIKSKEKFPPHTLLKCSFKKLKTFKLLSRTRKYTDVDLLILKLFIY